MQTFPPQVAFRYQVVSQGPRRITSGETPRETVLAVPAIQCHFPGDQRPRTVWERAIYPWLAQYRAEGLSVLKTLPRIPTSPPGRSLPPELIEFLKKTRSSMQHPRDLIRPDRVRSIPGSFSWVDRQVLHGGFLAQLSTEEIALYFFLVLVSGPEGTSYWGYRAISRLLKLPEDVVIRATAGLVTKGLVAFRYPTFQVLSLPPAPVTPRERP